mgnify:CR=1 FL=1
MSTADDGFRKARKALRDLLTDDVRNDEFYAITSCLNAATALHEAYLRGGAEREGR